MDFFRLDIDFGLQKFVNIEIFLYFMIDKKWYKNIFGKLM